MYEVKYYTQLLNLRNFKDKKNVLNFSCPYCGDSETNKSKSRGYIFFYKNSFIYKCHNCGISKKFETFLKDQNVSIYEEYIRNKLFSKYENKIEYSPPEESDIKLKNPLSEFEKITNLPNNHIAKIYLKNRKVPEEKYDLIYFSQNFKKFVNSVESFRFKNYIKSDKRIVLPAFNKSGNIIYYQARTIENDNLRYINYKLLKNYPKIYGLERIKTNKDIYITEGALDSLFLDNALAVAGSDLALPSLKKLNPILVYDNEPRNISIVTKMNKAINTGFRIVIHDSNNKNKDINDMVLDNIEPMQYLKERTFSGLRAKIELSNWSKVSYDN